MNIFLIPYAFSRHFCMAYWCAVFGVFAWVFVLGWFMLIGPFWSPSLDGLMWLMALSSAVAAASLLGEGNLFRWPIRQRLMKSALAAVVAGLLTILFYYIWEGFTSLFYAEAKDVDDPFLVSLKQQFGAFVAAGFACSVGVLAARRWENRQELFNHLTAGVLTGLATSVVWGFANTVDAGLDQNLYFSAASASLAFGFFFGLSAWGIPDRLYAGWIRVLSASRFGRRVPIDAKGEPKERFIGHYPNGLDLYLPADHGVFELHASFFVDEDQRYAIRGLTQAPTKLRRLFEWIRLDYDKTKPSPFETEIRSGDRVRLGDVTEVEFIMLPREER